MSGDGVVKVAIALSRALATLCTFNRYGRILEVCDGLRVNSSAAQDHDRIVDVGSTSRECTRYRLVSAYVSVTYFFEEVRRAANILESVDRAKERGDGDDLRRVEIDAASSRANQQRTGRRVIEGVAVIESDRAFDCLDGIVVKERSGVGSLDESRRIELSGARTAKTIVGRVFLTG